MTDLPKHTARLAAVFGFCAAALAGLLCDCPPLTAVARGAVCGAALGVLVWVAVRVALGVVAEGLRHRDTGPVKP